MSGRSPEALLGQIQAECKVVKETQAKTYSTGYKIVNSMIQKLERTKRKLAKSDTFTVAQKLCDGILKDKPHTTLTRDFKSLHGTVVHLGKTIDKNLKRTESCLYDRAAEQHSGASGSLDSKDLRCVIIHSLMRRGRFDIVDSMVQEMDLKMPVAESTRKIFEKMHSCCRALDSRDVTPALQWVTEVERIYCYPSNKQANGSGEKRAACQNIHLRSSYKDLRFQLLKLRYLQLVQERCGCIYCKPIIANGGKNAMEEEGASEGGGPGKCTGDLLKPITFARKYLAEFAGERQRDVERLTGALLFARDLLNSPYKDLYSDQAWKEVRSNFEAVFCRSHGFAGRDPLVVTLLASNIALPKRAKYASVLRARSNLLEEKDQAPLEINLGKSLQFHSTFVCPISKEQSTTSNPPMLLSCGHVISRAAMLKITRTRRSNRVKCPTCPVESAVSQVRVISF
ncbi:hypothetical protein AAMO2058_001044600 [Amorphochlora amoebiformis]